MNISTKCGKSNCPFYDETNHINKCLQFIDRNKCSISLSHKKNK